MSDEADLVAAARADPGGGGFAAVYQRYGDRIHDYCLAVLRHREDAADAAQDTFLIAYQRLDQLRDPAKLTPWLYAIARSRCLRRIADRKRQRPTDEWEGLSAPEAEPATEMQRGELQQLVWDAAAGLAATDRAVLDLHLRHGLSGAELADALGVPSEKANLMLHRMKQRMRRTIGALLVARTGRRDCADLADIATGELTPLTRKRLARHIERCQVCLARRDRLAPELVYASVPLVPAPLVLGERLAELTAELAAEFAAEVAAGPPAATSAAAPGDDGMRWGPDGFPRAGPSGVAVPLPRRLALGGGVAALIGLGLLGGYVTGRTIADDPAAVAPPGEPTPLVTTPGATPSGRLISVPPAPPAGGTPAAGGRPTSSPAPTGTPTPSAPPDVTAPTLSTLRLGGCGVTFTAEVDVTDTVDPTPTADLMLSWDPGPGSPVPMVHVGGNTYRAIVTREGAALGFVTFTAYGMVADAAGNSAFRQVTKDCTPIVD